MSSTGLQQMLFLWSEIHKKGKSALAYLNTVTCPAAGSREKLFAYIILLTCGCFQLFLFVVVVVFIYLCSLNQINVQKSSK